MKRIKAHHLFYDYLSSGRLIRYLILTTQQNQYHRQTSAVKIFSSHVELAPLLSMPTLSGMPLLAIVCLKNTVLAASSRQPCKTKPPNSTTDHTNKS